MSYERLFREYKESKPYEPIVELASQPQLAVLTLVVAMLCVSLAMVVSNSNKSLPIRFPLYTILVVIGSLLCGMGIVFTTNSFGVYV